MVSNSAPFSKINQLFPAKKPLSEREALMELMSLEEGVTFSSNKLADRFGWTRDKVRTFLPKAAETGLIKITKVINGIQIQHPGDPQVAPRLHTFLYNLAVGLGVNDPQLIPSLSPLNTQGASETAFAEILTTYRSIIDKSIIDNKAKCTPSLPKQIPLSLTNDDRTHFDLAAEGDGGKLPPAPRAKPPLVPLAPVYPRGSADSHVRLSDSDLKTLSEAFYGEGGDWRLKYWVDRLNDYAEMSPAKFAKYKNHRAVIQTWDKRKVESGCEWTGVGPEGPGFYPTWVVEKAREALIRDRDRNGDH